MKSVIQMMCVAAVVAALGSVAMAGVEIETVPVGNAGNIADSVGGYGAVDYSYNIGKYEVTAGQYRDFLNAVAKTDTYGLYNAQMDSHSYGCQITQNGVSGNYTYDFSGRPSGDESDWVNRPVNYVSWGDAARFANWLHNGQPTTGVQNDSTTEDGAYYLNGVTSLAGIKAVDRELDWKWAIPTEDEWYKAAYHKNDGDTGNYFDYPTSNDSEPSNDLDGGGNNATHYKSIGDYTIGSPYHRTEVGAHKNSDSPYGTFDQGGNVYEWNEAIILSYRGRRGASFGSHAESLLASYRLHDYTPSVEVPSIGFRVSEVPEPASMALLALGGAGMLMRRRHAGR